MPGLKTGMGFRGAEPVSRKARKLYWSEGKFWKQNLLDFLTQPLAHKPVNLASLTDSFIVSVYRGKSAEQIARKRPRLVH